jgi:hypothetical protein
MVLISKLQDDLKKSLNKKGIYIYIKEGGKDLNRLKYTKIYMD